MSSEEEEEGHRVVYRVRERPRVPWRKAAAGSPQARSRWVILAAAGSDQKGG